MLNVSLNLKIFLSTVLHILISCYLTNKNGEDCCSDHQLQYLNRLYIYCSTIIQSVIIRRLTYRKCEDGVSDLPFVMTSFPLPTINIEHIPICVSVDLPAFGSVKTLLPLCYCFKNRTPYVQDLQVAMDASDSFMFAGNKQVSSWDVLNTYCHRALTYLMATYRIYTCQR